MHSRFTLRVDTIEHSSYEAWWISRTPDNCGQQLHPIQERNQGSHRELKAGLYGDSQVPPWRLVWPRNTQRWWRRHPRRIYRKHTLPLSSNNDQRFAREKRLRPSLLNPPRFFADEKHEIHEVWAVLSIAILDKKDRLLFLLPINWTAESLPI